MRIWPILEHSLRQCNIKTHTSIIQYSILNNTTIILFLESSSIQIEYKRGDISCPAKQRL